MAFAYYYFSIPILAVYFVYQRLRRFENVRKIRKIAAQDPNLENEKTILDIHQIKNFYEFPWLQNKSLEFGLYRTYAIPSISKLLVHTGNLANMETVGKRYDDTNLLIREMFEHKGLIDQDVNLANGDLEKMRGRRAIERINALHGRYRIPNEDFLYVLSVFICEPIRWIERFGYRNLELIEKEAHYQTWCQVGIGMNMHSIPSSLEEMFAFNKAYEEKYMIYAPTNEIVSNSTTNLFLIHIPSFLHPFSKQVVSALCDKRLRKAMNIQDPSILGLETFLNIMLKMNACIQRYLMLPRTKPHHRTGNKLDSMGKYFYNWIEYIDTYPNGYKIEELGPKKFESDGRKISMGKRNENSMAPLGTYL